MSLQTRLTDLITAVGTDYKQLRVWITGSSTGDLTGLTTTAKSNLVSAINEVKASATGAPPAATESTSGVAAIATQTDTNTGTDDSKIVTPLKFATRLAAYAQPLNTNLTNLAGVANTTYGRGFLALANQAGLMALLAAASDTVVGVSRNATQAEVNAGTIDTVAVTPLKFQTRLAAYALPLSYLDTDATLSANSDTKVASQKAAKAYMDSRIAAGDAFVAKGGIDCSTNPNYPAADAGWTYRVTAAGRIGGASGVVVEVGDLIECFVDGTASGTQATVGANWSVVQTNIDGAVTGPGSSNAGDIPVFAGTSGKAVSSSGVSVEVSGTLASNADTKVPTTKSILTYLANTFYTKTDLGNPETDLAAAYATAKA